MTLRLIVNIYAFGDRCKAGIIDKAFSTEWPISACIVCLYWSEYE